MTNKYWNTTAFSLTARIPNSQVTPRAGRRVPSDRRPDLVIIENICFIRPFYKYNMYNSIFCYACMLVGLSLRRKQICKSILYDLWIHAICLRKLVLFYNVKLYVWYSVVGLCWGKDTNKTSFFFYTASKPNYMNIKILLGLTHDAFLRSEDLATMLEANNTLKSETIIRMLIWKKTNYFFYR